MTELSRAPAKRTTENSPALQCWVGGAINIQKPVKRATDVLREFLSSASRTHINNMSLIPAMNRWAIFVRPLRGLNHHNMNFDPTDESVGYFRSSASRTKSTCFRTWLRLLLNRGPLS